MKKLTKKFLIFDLDGVLIDSKRNMYLSWYKVQNKHNLHNISFENYFKNIGKPFFDILKSIGVKKDFNKIKKTYQNESLQKIDQIHYFVDVIKTLKFLKKKNFVLNIVTSKDRHRTIKFLGKYVNLFKSIECDNPKEKGKPHPDKINKIISISKYDKSQCVYIGDTNVDYVTAKNSNIDFIYAKWGYGKNYNYKYKCNNIKFLINILKS